MKKTLFLTLSTLMLLLCSCKKEVVAPTYNGDLSRTQVPPLERFFSIDSAKYIVFSPGNLQYQATTNTYRFAPQQNQMIGFDNAKMAADYEGWVDLFGWGTGKNPSLTSIEPQDYATFDDWGSHIAAAMGNYRTLTYKEWDYLLFRRPDADSKRAFGSVFGVKGLFLIPDTGYIALSTKTITDSAQWRRLDSLGVVFLPAAGYRFRNEVNCIDTTGSTYNGYYWSSDPSPVSTEGARCVYFYHTKDITTFDTFSTLFLRYNGRSVRLVQDYNKPARPTEK